MTPDEIGLGDWVEGQLEQLFEKIDYYRTRAGWSEEKTLDLLDEQIYMDAEDWAAWYYAQVRNNDE